MKFALATLLLLVPAFAFAQTDLTSLGSAGAPPPITLSLSTTYPQPLSSTLLSVESTAFSLANATLSVWVNGTNIYRGNVRPVPITIGAAGTATNISVTVASQGSSYGASLSVDPGDVSLIEEPVSSAPPLYAGKPGVPLGGEVRLVAIAAFRTSEGTPINPNTLSYTWKQGDTTLSANSGIGKSAIIVNTPLEYRSGDYSVLVSTQDGTEVGAGGVTLSAGTPLVRVYANDPLLGVRFDHALMGSYALQGPEASFYAAPYSFSLASGAPSLTWFIDGSSGATGNVITLRPTGSTAGKSSLSASASESSIYESAAANLSLSYGASSGTNIFGL